MTVHVQYEKNKVLQALRYHFISRPEIKVLLILVNVFAILSAVLMALKLIQALSLPDQLIHVVCTDDYLWFLCHLLFIREQLLLKRLLM